MYQLTVTDEQVQVLLKALDVYSRVGCGQFERILEMFLGDPRRQKDVPDCKLLFNRFKEQLLALTPDTSYSICSPDVPVDYRLAWDVLQVLRHHVAWRKQPEGGFTVNFDKPMNTSGAPLCRIETV